MFEHYSALCCCTLGCSLLPVVCLSRRSINAIEKLLDYENARLYNKLGLNWRLARQHCDTNNLTEFVLLIEFLDRESILKPD